MRRRAFVAICLATGATGCLTGDSGGAVRSATPSAADRSETDGNGTDGTGGAPTTTTATRASTTAAEYRTQSTAVTESSAGTSTATPPAAFEGYETTEIEVTTPDGEPLGAVTAAVADTTDLRYTGLSDVESLPETYGMLFVYDSVGEYTYVMRDMDFGIDIVFADDEGVITRIHHAPEPGPNEDGEDQTYPGRGQYVLEVAYEWTTERGVEAGDVLAFDR